MSLQFFICEVDADLLKTISEQGFVSLIAFKFIHYCLKVEQVWIVVRSNRYVVAMTNVCVYFFLPETKYVPIEIMNITFKQNAHAHPDSIVLLVKVLLFGVILLVLGQLDGTLDVVIITTQISPDPYKICGYWKLSQFQTQMAAAVSNSPLGREHYGNDGMEGVKPSYRRRVFVQTETDRVLGMDLDRGDNAHTVKRRLPIALSVPIEESSLTFGDMVRKNDLSASDQSGPTEILGHSVSFKNPKQLVKEIVKAMKIGVDPVPVRGGLGGAYYFRNSRGESVAIVKPTDKKPFAPNNPKTFVGRALGQPGIKRSVRVG
nr:hypothetical protein [Tanacetum cinerariifolium]